MKAANKESEVDMSQEDKILDYLKSGKSITPIEALSMFGCFRLSGRIYDLRHKGYHIEEVDVERNGKRFASYYLATEPESIIIRDNLAREKVINEKATQMEFVDVR